MYKHIQKTHKTFNLFKKPSKNRPGETKATKAKIKKNKN